MRISRVWKVLLLTSSCSCRCRRAIFLPIFALESFATSFFSGLLLSSPRSATSVSLLYIGCESTWSALDKPLAQPSSPVAALRDSLVLQRLDSSNILDSILVVLKMRWPHSSLKSTLSKSLSQLSAVHSEHSSGHARKRGESRGGRVVYSGLTGGYKC